MNNYQLYRSNVALGGQLKWNISVDNGTSGLFVSDFHIVPVSERVPYNRYAKDNLLNYSHLENIKAFYHKIESSFYKPYPNPILSSNQPYISNKSERHNLIDLHDDTFDMGAHRAKYSVYGKEIEIFCPVWLEDVAGKKLSFTFYIKGKDQNGVVNTLCTKTLTLDPSATVGGYHDRFVKYLYKYIDDIELDDRIVKIDLNSSTAVVTGIDVSTGLVKVVDANKLTWDLVNKERLLMDADSLIIDQFANNHLIAKQLFNFSFLFNSEDFFPPTIMKMIKGERIYLDVDVRVDGDVLEIKDFYTNYLDIPSKYIGSLDTSGKEITDKHVNVLEELGDYRNMELMGKNELIQSICHWSIIGDNDYIFNVYPEFGGFFTQTVNKNTTTIKVNQLYQNTPNIWTDKYYSDSNALGWVNVHNITDLFDYVNIADAIDELIGESSEIAEWVNHIHYGLSKDELDKLKKQIRYISIIKVRSLGDPNITANEWTKIQLNFNKNADSFNIKSAQGNVSDNDIRYWKLKGDEKNPDKAAMLCLIPIEIGGVPSNILLIYTCEYDTSFMNGSTFMGLLELLSGCKLYKNTEFEEEKYINVNVEKNKLLEPLKYLKHWLESVTQPSVISFNTSLKYMIADGPSNSISELEHYDTKVNKRVIRMGGYIRPTFVAPDMNIIYTKKYFESNDQFNESAFPIYTNSGYPPKYPSIGFYSFDRHNLNSGGGRDVDLLVTDEQYLPYEYRWFTTSRVYLLIPEFVIKVESEPRPIPDIIREYLQDMYSLSDDESYYIYNLYSWSSDWEYADIADIEHYKYTIKMKLK